jgi:hypothetical protein
VLPVATPVLLQFERPRKGGRSVAFLSA